MSGRRQLVGRIAVSALEVVEPQWVQVMVRSASARSVISLISSCLGLGLGLGVGLGLGLGQGLPN